MPVRFNIADGLPNGSPQVELVPRRQFVRGLGLSMFGLSLPEVLRRQALARASGAVSMGRAKRCIMIFLFGGPSQIDTWDMKPQAAVEYRGEFAPIDTAVPGLQCCEHLPRTARLTEHLCVVRSLSMTGRGIGDHHADTYYILTGRKPDGTFFTQGIDRKPHDDDWPCLGSAVSWRLPHDPDLPGVVQLPALSGEVTNYINPGQFAGRLGPAHEPFLVRGALEKPRELAVPALALPGEIDGARLGDRRNLLSRFDAWQRQAERQVALLDAYEAHQRKAFTLLTSDRSKRAFDVSLESEETRRRYGEDINGQSVLLARRLAEAGVPFVCVHWIGQRVGAGLSWDTHSDNFGQLKNVLLPAFDRCFSALIEDLAGSGMLDETLVLVAAEMGRTPKVGDPRTAQGPPGRDHWIHCQTALLAGGGVQGGQVYGSSDAVAGYPADHPVSPEDLAVTAYRALGIDDDMLFTDRQGRVQSLIEDGARPLPVLGS
jgi:hypothetical protein